MVKCLCKDRIMFLWKKKTPTAPPITVYIMYLCAYCPKHSSKESITSMTMAMGPAKLQMSLSSMEIQQKSGFPYPSGSSPTARPAAKRKTVRSDRKRNFILILLIMETATETGSTWWCAVYYTTVVVKLKEIQQVTSLVTISHYWYNILGVCLAGQSQK